MLFKFKTFNRRHNSNFTWKDIFVKIQIQYKKRVKNELVCMDAVIANRARGIALPFFSLMFKCSFFSVTELNTLCKVV